MPRLVPKPAVDRSFLASAVFDPSFAMVLLALFSGHTVVCLNPIIRFSADCSSSRLLVFRAEAPSARTHWCCSCIWSCACCKVSIAHDISRKSTTQSPSAALWYHFWLRAHVERSLEARVIPNFSLRRGLCVLDISEAALLLLRLALRPWPWPFALVLTLALALDRASQTTVLRCSIASTESSMVSIVGR